MCAEPQILCQSPLEKHEFCRNFRVFSHRVASCCLGSKLFTQFFAAMTEVQTIVVSVSGISGISWDFQLISEQCEVGASEGSPTSPQTGKSAKTEDDVIADLQPVAAEDRSVSCVGNHWENPRGFGRPCKPFFTCRKRNRKKQSDWSRRSCWWKLAFLRELFLKDLPLKRYLWTWNGMSYTPSHLVIPW